MTLSTKGAALALAALVSVAPYAAVAETSPMGLQASVPTTSSPAQPNLLLAMFTPSSPPGGSSAPLLGGLLPVCHRSAGGCDGSSGTGSSSTSTLKFPSARGKVIFEHRWSSGDIPSSMQTPGGGKAGTRFASKKFRLPDRPAGRYKIVTDPETGASVLDILVTRADEARTGSHHTQVEVSIPSYWDSGRYMKRGERYLLEYWRKNINYRADTKWEIWWQNHSRFDNSTERGRNPVVSIGGDRKGRLALNIRADSKSTTYKRDGNWVYTRDSFYSFGSSASSSWELWQMEIELDYNRGALHLWRNGTLIHSEEGRPVGYNDEYGTPWAFGWYKYFKGSDVDSRQAYIGPVRVQKL